MKRFPWLAVTVVALGLVILRLAPEEKTLGSAVRIVYLHGALIWASLILYTLSGLGGAAYLWRRGARTFVAATTLWRWAVIANSVSLPTGLYAAKVIWGAVLWSEPRVLVNAMMLLTSLLVLGVSLISANRPGLSGLYSVASVSYLVMLNRASRILHPDNPIGQSNSLAIKASFAVITLLALALAVEAVRRDIRAQAASERDEPPSHTTPSA